MKPWSAATPAALFISSIVHLFLAWTIAEKVASLPALQREEPAMFAELVQPAEIAPPKREIAPPSQAPEVERAPDNARLGEKTTQTPRESVRRGDDVEQPSRPQEKASPQKAVPPMRQTPPPKLRETKPRSPPSQPRLTLGENDVLARLGPGTLDPSGTPSGADDVPKAKEEKQQDDRTREMKFLSAEPFRRKSSFSVLNPGVSDLLNNIPDGEITLLNEKADLFAVFVRRVALQVFGALRRSGWGLLPYSEVNGISKFARIRAIMSPQGKFLRAEALDGSGSFRFDELFRDAVEQGVSDQNPPKAAVATDGNFHFIFLARTWARRTPGAMPEQRWMILGTGLE